MPLPEALGGIAWRRVNDHLVAVPRLDRGDELMPAFQHPFLYFTAAAIAFGIRLIADSQPSPGPLARHVVTEQVHSLVTGGQQVRSPGSLRFNRPEVMDDMQTFVNDMGRPAVMHRVA